jgi:hypothetical protein
VDQPASPEKGRGDAMLDILFWVFFGIGFLVIVVMIVFVFREIWRVRKEREIWKGLSGKSSLLGN